MVQMTLKIDGMQCGMCESHVNDTLRAAFPLKKVSSSHSKGETVLVTAEEIPRTPCDVRSSRLATSLCPCRARLMSSAVCSTAADSPAGCALPLSRRFPFCAACGMLYPERSAARL